MPFVANRSRLAAEHWEFTPNTVCISITDPDSPNAKLSEGFWETIRLKFHDVERMEDFNKCAPVTEEQIKDIADFILKHRGRNILVHCEAGVSRSGGVAEAILDTFPEYRDEGWDRAANGLVKSLLKRALGNVPIGA